MKFLDELKKVLKSSILLAMSQLLKSDLYLCWISDKFYRSKFQSEMFLSVMVTLVKIDFYPGDLIGYCLFISQIPCPKLRNENIIRGNGLFTSHVHLRTDVRFDGSRHLSPPVLFSNQFYRIFTIGSVH